MKFLQRFFFLLFVGLSLCTMQACSDDDDEYCDPLIGSWYYLRIDGTCRWEYTYTFEADGGFEFSGTTYATSDGNDIWDMHYGTSSGTYTKDEKNLKIVYKDGYFKGETKKYTIMSLNKSNLVLKSESGFIKSFTKLE